MKRFAVLPLALALAGCGLQPLYGGGAHGATGIVLGEIEVGPIGGQQGWLLRAALSDRLHAAAHGQARYRLDVELDDQIIGLGINNQNTVTRERRTLRARYRLVDLAQASTVVLDATAGADTGLDVTSSDYSTLAAEQTSLEHLSDEVADQIVARVALYARRTATK